MTNFIINPSELVDTMEKVLNDYNKKVVGNAVKKETKKAMKELVRVTKATAPVGKRKKHYKDNIKSKKYLDKDSAVGLSYGEVWYVDGPDYRLTHLLEHGHQLRNGKRSRAFNFVKKAYTDVENKYVKALKEAIEHGR
ncbi:HK97 gp10 family phage protein [Peptostreptococcus sp. D1]|uniref:HK97 gp10 family phage protein n=1 Tax=Peptostreptococcus sp. D1 TaxID=72304 RepID=UPI0008F1FD4C|nr:HK97 gp10 family phage protein [Peptostreptococcus sp. D1]SFE84062.1 Bacteriophage HK97-gp10, putative tail-component [Peptostreptococcus sp. D1]